MASTSTNTQHHRSFGLDFARALAICLVLFAHFARSLESFGFWGVELFFALSGFLIGQILWKSYSGTEEWSFKYLYNFWSRRWWRTIPNYFLFLVIMIFFHNYYHFAVPSIPMVVKHLWFGQDFLKRDGGFFGVSWSLCVEEWFYLLFPITLFVISKLGFKNKTTFVIALSVMFIGCAIIREILIGKYIENDIRSITLARLDAIACGVTVAFWLSVANVTSEKKWIAFFIGLAFLFTAIFVFYSGGQLFDKAIKVRYLLLFVPMGFSFTLPVIGMMPRPVGIYNSISIAVEKISLWSYSIYLVHIPVLFVLYKIFFNFRASGINNLFSKVIALTITVIISALIFKYFELPLTRKRPREL